MASKTDSLVRTQHGGDHYKTFVIEPAEYLGKNDIPFLPGEAIKYLSRYRLKNRAEDVKKAMHYCQMILDMEYGITSKVEYTDRCPTATVEKVLNR